MARNNNGNGISWTSHGVSKILSVFATMIPKEVRIRTSVIVLPDPQQEMGGCERGKETRHPGTSEIEEDKKMKHCPFLKANKIPKVEISIFTGASEKKAIFGSKKQAKKLVFTKIGFAFFIYLKSGETRGVQHDICPSTRGLACLQ